MLSFPRARPWSNGNRAALAPVAAAILLAACTVGPTYQRPQAPMAAAWSTPEAPWRTARPTDAQLKGRWWELFGDETLNRLQQQAAERGQVLRIAAARLEQARALVQSNAAALLPSVQLNGGASRLKISADRPLSNYNTTNYSTTQNDLRLGVTVSYEADLVGRIRNQVAAAQANAEQSEADLQNVRLLVAADLATNYFNLRSTDTEIQVVREGIDLQRRALGLVRDRHELGAASGLDVAQQQAVLDATQTQLRLLERQRELFEHAVATLVGEPAPTFSLPAARLTGEPPGIAAGLPSDLLERRPDVAAAERAMAAANAQIGVATAAFYPSLPLVANGGFESTNFASLLSAPAILWSLGASAAQMLFDNGRARAGVRFAEAGYDATVASYRQTVLVAMQEVQNGVSSLESLALASREAASAVGSSQKVLGIANDRYSGGLSTYLDVITAQQSLLNNQRQAAQILGQQMLTSVYLIKALGGGWTGLDRSQLSGAEGGAAPRSALDASPLARASGEEGR